jgi:hypothetical protein
VSPDHLSISKLAASGPDSPAFELTVNVKQAWAVGDCPQPLTICTAYNVLGRDDPSIHVTMSCRNIKGKALLGDPLSGGHMRYAEPTSDDWKTELPFATIPPGEGLTVTKTITCGRLLKAWGFRAQGNEKPKAGEECELYFTPSRREPLTLWWNWGDLEGDLKDRKLVDMVDPRLNGIENASPPEPPVLLPFKSWEDTEDQQGRMIVRLLAHYDTTPVVVKFVE